MFNFLDNRSTRKHACDETFILQYSYMNAKWGFYRIFHISLMATNENSSAIILNLQICKTKSSTRTTVVEVGFFFKV